MRYCERCAVDCWAVEEQKDRDFYLSSGERLKLCGPCADEWELMPEEVQYKNVTAIREKAVWKFCKENNPWKESFEDFMLRLEYMK